MTPTFSQKSYWMASCPGVSSMPVNMLYSVADVERRAAGRADPLAAVVVLRRLMLADLVLAGPQAGEFDTRRWRW